MAIDFKAALTYPWEKEHWIQAVVLPAAGTLAFFMLSGLSMAITPFVPPIGALSGAMTGIVFNALMAGYAWHCCAAWQTTGAHAAPPIWKRDFTGILLDGLRLSLYFFLLVALPVGVLGMLLMGTVLAQLFAGAALLTQGSMPTFSDAVAWATLTQMTLFLLVLAVGGILLGPFVVAPIVRSAQDRKLGTLFDLPAGFALAFSRYGRGLSALGWVVLLNVTYVVSQCLLSLTGVGALSFLLMMPMLISTLHLWNQALGEVAESSVLAGESAASDVSSKGSQ